MGKGVKRARLLDCLAVLLLASCASDDRPQQISVSSLSHGHKELVGNYADDPTSHYPAAVTGMVWGGSRLDARTPARFGVWQMRFTAPAYLAVYYPVEPTRAYRMITVGGVNDKNSMGCGNVVGEARCMLVIDLDQGGCRFSTFDSLPGSPAYSTISVPCPTAIEFER
jgi:hypothetical protein